MSDAALELIEIRRGFQQGTGRLEVLQGASLALHAGEIVAMVGPSGAGKSTLLHIAGLLEPPDSGEVWVGEVACSGLGDARRTELRRLHLGFVYQFHHLLPEFSAAENVALPQMVAGVAWKVALPRADELLDGVGLAERANHRPAQLSGGEQQRVAIARALANGPKVLLADEPTGNLDQHTADGVFETLLAMVRYAGLAALIATHNTELADRMDRTIRIENGRLVEAT